MQKAVVVDLDGTLLKKNSFEEFYRQLAVFAVLRMRLKLFWWLFLTIVRRKLRLISHAELKRITLLRLLNEDLSPFVGLFAGRMKAWISECVVRELHDYAEKGYRILLSTAAPELYVARIMAEAQVDVAAILATGFPKDSDWRENSGEEKARRTLACAREMGHELAVLMTDHSDDLPLLKIPKERNVLVNPSEVTILAVSQCKIPYDVIRS